MQCVFTQGTCICILIVQLPDCAASWLYQLHTGTGVQQKLQSHNWPWLEETKNGSKARDKSSA